MANAQANMEIVDVLSSIRRLVSENRRAEPAAAPGTNVVPAETVAPPAAPAAPVGSRLPAESRLVLTAAHRVDPADGAEEALLLTDELTPAPLAEAAPEAPAASLEATIAELEAAVAVIDEEFEPDLGDATLAPDDEAGIADWDDAIEAASMPEAVAAPPVVAAPIVQFSGIHGGIMGFGALPPPEDRLDLPIIGDLTMPLIPKGESWRVALPARRAEAESAAVAPPVADALADSDGSLFVSDADVAAAPEGALVLDEAAASDATAYPDDGDHLAAADQASAAEDAIGSAEAEFGAVAEAEAVPAAPEPEPADEAPSAGERRLHFGSAPSVRPVILRPPLPEAEPVALATDEDGLDEDALDAAAGEDDLFGPGAGAGADIDLAMLRELVGEIIREELRGTLGERITRNVRALVRREIDRVIADELLKRD